MKNNTTTPVFGDDFMFRDYEKNYCVNSLKEGNSILILGIRRTGKSSLLKEVARLMREEDYKIVVIDCQENNKPSELFLEILKALPKDTFQKFTEHLKTLKSIPKNIIDILNIDTIKGYGVDIKFDKQIRDYWTPLSKSIEKILLNKDEKIILFLDELPYFFENLIDSNNQYSEIEVKQILATLRSWRNEGIQMVLCGSLNIRYLLNSFSISEKLLAGLTSIDINLFTDDEAKQLLFKLAKSKGITWISDDIADKIIELVQDNVPFFIQTFFAELLLEKDCSLERINEIYDIRVYPKLIKNFLYQFQERLSKYSQDEMVKVEKVLDYISIHDSATFDNLRKQDKSIDLEILLKLTGDEFLKPAGAGNYSFALNIVKNWWKVFRGIK
ncbi:MAG: AAA family ATPase [Prolixibacteraceae bacterium]|nr:AAA family ATPase [Prolixibacteraceae bacterium]